MIEKYNKQRIQNTIRYDDLGFAYELKEIPLNEISFKEKDPVMIETRSSKYAAMMLQGKKFPPIKVFGKRYAEDTFQVFDGHARVTASKINKLSRIMAEITLIDRLGKPIKKN